MQLRWSHAVMYVRDLPAMLDFYTELLGFEVADRGPAGPPGGPEILFLSQVETDHHQLAMVNIRRDEDRPNSVDHFAFRTGSLSDVKQLAARLGEDGRASELRPISHGNAWSIYFRDPEGNGIEVFCDSPFHVAQPQLTTWDLAMSEEELLAKTIEEFEKEPGFGPIDAFYASRAAKLRDR